MSGYGLPRGRFALLFTVMLVAAAGNTAMQSLLPSIGRELGVPDLWVAAAFSLSAVLWVVAAPFWARRADRRGRRELMRLGLLGFVLSMLICGGIVAVGLAGLMPPMLVFLIFSLARGLYGALGSASPPAVQAYIAARTEGEQRTNALSALASSFGLGTIIGPAAAPLFIFPPLGLSGPLIVFAGIGLLVLAAIILRLPDDTPRTSARGRIVEYPAIGSGGRRVEQGDDEEEDPGPTSKLGWSDPRVARWSIAGVVGGHGYAAMLGAIGFLVIDRIGLPAEEAQQPIAIVLMGGAVATLLGQWWLIPQLHLAPRALVIWGSVLAALGSVLVGLAGGIYGLTLSFALASLGFGLYRPGFTSGASLAVSMREQNAVAGVVTSVNGIPYIVGPALGVLLYGIWMPLPFILTGATMAVLALWASFRLRPSDHAASTSPG
jgi:MFS family permease